MRTSISQHAIDRGQRQRRSARVKQPPPAQAAAGLLVVGLRQRLVSSIEAFARTLAVHRRTVERAVATAAESQPLPTPQAGLFTSAPGPDDERAGWSGEERSLEEATEAEAVTSVAEQALSDHVGQGREPIGS